MLETLSACNLCGSSRFTVIDEKPGRLTAHVFRIVRCDECSLVFVNPRLDEAENAKLYEEDYYGGSGFDASVNYERLGEEREQRAREGRGMVAKIRVLRPEKDLRVLDVGCGVGCFLVALREAGYEHVEGLELSSFAAEAARKATGVRVRQGDLLHTDFGPDERFDVISAIEVIEHLRDPMAFFRKVHDLLAPGGIFVYTTGNEQGIYARVLGRRWPYLVPEGHLFYFSPTTLKRYFEAAGMQALDWRTLEPEKRKRMLAAEGAIAHAQLSYVGMSDPGAKGLLFRAVAALSPGPAKRLVSRVVGKYDLPVAVRPA